MKKIITALCIASLAFTAQAQDNYLQIIPTEISKDTEYPSLNLEMINEVTFTMFQFDITLPDGLILDDPAYNKDLPLERFPHVTNRGTTTYDHTVAYNAHDGVTTFLISTSATSADGTTLSTIDGNSGTILELWFKTLDNSISDGFYPIKISNIVFTDVNSQPYKSPDIATYIYVGSLPTSGTIDLSSLTGYMPADVVTATNELLADNTDVTSIDLSCLDNAASAITPANKNALVYAKAGSDFATVQAGNNVVVGETCKNLVLTDDYPFAASKAFTATAASYSRTVPAAGWYSLCLPFAAETPDGITVERYVSKDVANNTVTFNSGSIEADKPCIFKTTATSVTFSGSDVAVAVTGSELTDGDFVGTYSKVEGTLEGFYCLHPDGTGFGTATSTAYVDPFRAYINTSENSASALKIIHGDDDGTTGITAVNTEANESSKIYYNLLGQRVAQPKKGLYIVDGKTVIYK